MKTFYVFREGLVAGYDRIDLKGLSYGSDGLDAVYRAGMRVGRFAARLFHHEPDVYELRNKDEHR
jgi:hypothetical protein